MNTSIHVNLSNHYGLLQSMKIYNSPEQILKDINEYFGVDISRLRNVDMSSGDRVIVGVLRQCFMKICFDNLQMKHEDIAKYLNCKRVNVINMLKIFNESLDVNRQGNTYYTLCLNLVAKNLVV